MSILSSKAHHDPEERNTAPSLGHDQGKNSGFWQSWLRPKTIERLIVTCDVLLIVCCGLVSAAGYLWSTTGAVEKIDIYAAASALVALNFVLLVAVQHGYRLTSMTSPLGQIRVTMLTWIGVFAVLLAIGFTMKISDTFSRGATILFFCSGVLLLPAWKAIAAALITRALRTEAFTNSRVVVMAEQGMAASSVPLRELRRHGYRPARILEISATELSSPLLMSAVMPRVQELIDFVRDNRIEHVYLLVSWNRQHAIDSLLDALKVLPIPVHLVPDPHVARFLRYPLSEAGAGWTAELRRAPLSKSERSVKRLFDLVGASAALLLFAPIMLAAALLIKSESRGSILFRQTRNGFNGRTFRIYKFRSMQVAEDGPNIIQATRHDARVTRVGRWLRKTSIDELPQLFNVLRGEMSLVGPRPHAAAHNTQYEQMIGSYAFRHHVKPGITGWAQVNGYRGETSAIGLMEKRVELDLWYINNWSLWLDFRIAIGTALVSFRQTAAY